jgi:hypothetical protein
MKWSRSDTCWLAALIFMTLLLMAVTVRVYADGWLRLGDPVCWCLLLVWVLVCMTWSAAWRWWSQE